MYAMIVDKDGNPIEQSNPLKIQIANIPDVDIRGQSAMKVTAAGAGDIVLNASYGKIFGCSVVGGITVRLKDGATEIWDLGTQVTCPIICATSVVLNFSAAGDAFLIYSW